MIQEITFRPEDRDLYEAIECGDKRFELRAGSDKYRAIRVGDEVVVRCEALQCRRTVVGIGIFSDLDELRANYDPADLIPGAKSWDDVWHRVTASPGYAQRMATEGIIVFEFEPVS